MALLEQSKKKMNFDFIHLSPTELQEHLAQATIYATDIDTTAGTLRIYATEKGIFETHFDQTPSEHYPHTQFLHHDAFQKLFPQPYPLIITGTDLQIKVWQATCAIPAGTTVSYSKLAQKIGHPKAVRAVANALAANKIAYFIPCHRVIAKDGTLGGYAWGIGLKKELLIQEKC